MSQDASQGIRREITGEHLKLAGSTTQGTRVGDFLFLGSQTPHDPVTGRLIRTMDEAPVGIRRQVESGMTIADVPERRIRAQTWRALQNLQDLLTASGSSLESLAHLRVFLRDMRDATSAIQVLTAMIPEGLPSTSIVGATGEGVDGSIDVQVDAIAVVPAGGTQRVNILLPDLASLTSPFPTATQAGPFLFTTPVAGVDPRTGAVITRISELEPEDQQMAGGPYNLRDEARVAQHLAVWRNIQRILASQRVPFANILHQFGALRYPMREFVPVTAVRRRLFGVGGRRTATTVFPMSGIRREDADSEYKVIALVPGNGPGTDRKEIRVGGHGVGPYYLAAVKAGPFVFTAGEVAINTAVPKHIDSAADLEATDDMRLLPYGRVHRERAIMPQAHYVYRLLTDALATYGCSPADVVHQTVYMVDVNDYPALERIATLYYGPKLPPTTIVPILGTSPFAEARLEIEMVAADPRIR